MIRIYILYVVLFFVSLVYPQEGIDSLNIITLKRNVHQSTGIQKLKLLDSLCWITRDKPELKYDSIVRATIEYAIILDSFNIANRQAARLVWSLTNRQGKPKEAKAFFETFNARNLPVTDNALLARFYINGGDSYYFSEEVKKSIELYNLGSSYALKAGDSILYGISKKYIADAHARMGNLVEASLILKDVEAIYLNTKDTIRLINTKSSRADLYSMNGFYKEAKVERDEAIALAEKTHYESGLISALINTAIDDHKRGDYKQQISNLKLALEHARHSKEVKNHYEPQILNKLFEEYSVLDSIEKATEILKILQTKPDYTKQLFKDSHIKGLAYYYLAKKDFSKALEYAQRHYNFQISNNSVEYITGAHELLYKVYQAYGDADKALYHFKEAKHISDSIFSLERTNVLSYYQTLYETKKRDATIERQESEIALLDVENKIKTQWLLFGGLGLLSLFFIVYLVRSRKFAVSKQILQEQFSQDLINQQEKERTRLARELHDGVGQKLMLLSKQTKTKGDGNMENLANSSLEELRNISRGLHPSNLERLGLTEAINALIYDINENTDLFFTEAIENIDNILPKTSELHLYRIIQESLSNIVKHSQAKSVEITIEKTNATVEVFITDNGIGFDLESKQEKRSLGMKTLFERAKIINTQMNIESDLGKGTVITLSIPI